MFELFRTGAVSSLTISLGIAFCFRREIARLGSPLNFDRALLPFRQSTLARRIVTDVHSAARYIATGPYKQSARNPSD